MADERAIQQQQDVFDRAIRVYAERDAVRMGLWMDYLPRDQIVQAKLKIERCLSLLEKKPEGWEQEVRKEIPDILNYAAFADRLITGDAS
jgi:hypothetical protein